MNAVVDANLYYHALVALLECSDTEQSRYNQLYYLFNRFCYEETIEAKNLFSNLYARIDYLCNTRGVSLATRQLLNQLRIEIRQQLSHPSSYTTEQWQQYVKQMAILVEQFTDTPQPLPLLQIELKQHTPTTHIARSDSHQRATVVERSEEGAIWLQLHNDTSQERYRLILHPHHDKQLFIESLASLKVGMQVNLIGVSYATDEATIYADIVVVEPDFLMDISVLASNFKEYGAHPLNLHVARLLPDENTRHILLGNIANLFLDELVNETEEGEPVTYESSMRKAFHASPLNIAACPDLIDAPKEREFFEQCRTQFDQLKEVVHTHFAEQHIACERALLEPSFISELLGIQGRLDLLSDDYSSFIELKSGKALELSSDKSKISHRETHYVQMMLYYAILHYSMGVESKQVHAYLLYSRYPQLYQMAPYLGLVKQAINLRNRIVAIEYEIAMHNDPLYTQRILQAATPQRLNERMLDTREWHKYHCSPLVRLQKQLSNLPLEEGLYLAALYTFITKEQYLAKAGDGNRGESTSSASALWSCSASEKLESGEMIANLTLVSNEIEEQYQRLVLRQTQPPLGVEPNFRVGDMVVLYRRDSEQQYACNQQVLKGAIESIGNQLISIRLRQIQRNPKLLSTTSLYAIEHDQPDTGFSLMYKGLSQFLTTNSDRRELLLGKRNPRFDNARYEKLRQTAVSTLDHTVAKALAAQDYFLLVGPPGTGKTSQALRRIVMGYLEQPKSNILLIAHTNKAVDEICHSLDSISGGVDYLRIGHEVACDKQFRSHLLGQRIAHCNSRKEVATHIEQCRIVVATLTTLCTRMDLFRLKQFDVAIVDEASQIVEPQLLGLLCATVGNEARNAIERFILIGDHKQLPAIVLQHEEDSHIHLSPLVELGIRNLRESLFERLLRNEQQVASHCWGALTLQGRMHPEVGAFATKMFYGGNLSPIPLPHQEAALPAVQHPYPLAQALLSHRFAFIHIESENKGGVTCKVNLPEARYAAQLIYWIYQEQLLQTGSFDPTTHIGVITPYRSQIAAIKRELEQYHVAALMEITVDTVERFQGGQREVMLFSCCVNTPLQLQLLCNTMVEHGIAIDRKLNVALTRARQQLFILGNASLLERDPIYSQLVAHCRERGGYFETNVM